ncbi:DinB family protein [Desulfopila aestuarii]|uniref:DinB superfamily protein n=1 Tax=Desulfopila aestuarii DSM 18488 TaxID=1121416 RepID=A0A1M7Y3R1_9BACT|nr:DinB family protein [Desulfopila aestuarii]SHO46810.1 DinB superfamily protein [Desulfopila aestuarii DSM 18488]
MMQEIPYLLEALSRSPKILSEFVKTIPENKLDSRRGESFWTIAEHYSHLAQVQPMLLKRFERFMNEDKPEFFPYVPGGGEKEPETPLCMSIDAALDQFASYRTRQLQLLENADDSSWGKTGIHPEYEEYSLYILTRHVLMHDHWHMYRMEELWLTRDAYLTRLE